MPRQLNYPSTYHLLPLVPLAAILGRFATAAARCAVRCARVPPDDSDAGAFTLPLPKVAPPLALKDAEGPLGLNEGLEPGVWNAELLKFIPDGAKGFCACEAWCAFGVNGLPKGDCPKVDWFDVVGDAPKGDC